MTSYFTAIFFPLLIKKQKWQLSFLFLCFLSQQTETLRHMQVQFNYRVQSVTKPNPLNIKRWKNQRSGWPHHCQIRNQRHPQLIIPEKQEQTPSDQITLAKRKKKHDECNNIQLTLLLPSYSFNNGCFLMEPLRLGHSSQEPDISPCSRYEINPKSYSLRFWNFRGVSTFRHVVQREKERVRERVTWDGLFGLREYKYEGC